MCVLGAAQLITQNTLDGWYEGLGKICYHGFCAVPQVTVTPARKGPNIWVFLYLQQHLSACDWNVWLHNFDKSTLKRDHINRILPELPFLNWIPQVTFHSFTLIQLYSGLVWNTLFRYFKLASGFTRSIMNNLTMNHYTVHHSMKHSTLSPGFITRTWARTLIHTTIDVTHEMRSPSTAWIKQLVKIWYSVTARRKNNSISGRAEWEADEKKQVPLIVSQM